MKTPRDPQTRDPEPGAGLPMQTTRELSHSLQSGIVKLERRRTPWWSGFDNTWLIWRGGW